ncbi:hypothetical protein HQ545_03245 [Candidatus Woesearchaeota archaeon]|nr:hypothetical protein [Candidatus Woesearchaeota archaeon]
MKFNSFDFVKPSIEDVKRLLFPIEPSKWFKLGLVSMLSGGGRGGGFGGGRGLNFNIPTGRNQESKSLLENVSNTTNEITGGAVQSVKSAIGGWYYLILPILIFLFILFVIMNFITSVFTFIFIESLDTRKVLIKKGWKRNKGVGFSLFLFRIVIGLIVLGILVLMTLPMIIPMIQQGFSAYFDNFSLWNIAWMIPAFVLFLLFMLILSVFMTLFRNVSILHMYFKRMPAWASLKTTFKQMSNHKIETLVFFLALVVIGIVVGIGSVIVAVLIIMVFFLLALPFTLIFWLLGVSIGWNILVILGAITVSAVFFIAFIYALSVVLLPLSTYGTYFSIRNYKALMKK